MSVEYAGAGTLLPPLAATVPGLVGALDRERVARRIERTLLRPGRRVSGVAPHALWFEADGSCSLRYRVVVSTGTDLGEHMVLARVPPPDDGGGDAALSLFPTDPALPTLASAMDPAALADGDWPCPTARPLAVELVHHSRKGPAVLRYTVRRAGSSASSDHLYGKVYPDAATGQRVQDFLASCTPHRRYVPIPLGYAPRSRLGLTDALPGRALLPTLIRSITETSSTERAGDAAIDSALQAVRSAGRTLADLHSTARATAPARTLAELDRELAGELDVVQQVWPRTANDIRSWIDAGDVGVDVAPKSERVVLCHGDFTPSQVLLVGRSVSGVVDFDTVCWSEAALDLGRFLAHLDLLVAKHHGSSADALRERLAESFVAGYGESVPLEDGLLERVALFRSRSLATTALHACRSLKERRMQLALSLLSSTLPTPQPNRTGKAPHAHLV